MNFLHRLNPDLRFDSDEKRAAETIGISGSGLKQMRLRGRIPNFCYTKIGHRTIRYCLPLLQEWQLNPDDLEHQARLASQLTASGCGGYTRKRANSSAQKKAALE
jgi:hypothetical protein